MGKLTIPFLIGAATMALCSVGRAQEPAPSSPALIGTFDSRVIATAFYRTEEQVQYGQGLHAEYLEAKASGDEWRARELAAYLQAVLHRTTHKVFSTGSIREIMETVSGELLEIAQEAGVSVIVSKWEIAYNSPAVEFVDLTPQLVALFDPDEQMLMYVGSFKTIDPIPMDQLPVPDIDEGRKLSVAEAIRTAIDERGVEAGVEHYRELRKTAIEHYRELREAATKEYNFAESELNELGYRYMGEGETETAIEMFKLNVEAYPAGFNTYDSLGEAYMEAGQTELAIKNYERSLELNPGNDNAREMLQRLGGDVEDKGEGATE